MNFVWNFCNDIQKTALRQCKRWPTGFDLIKLTTGTSKEIGLHSGSIASVCQQYEMSRRQKRRPRLRYRGKKSLGWIPFKGRDIKITDDSFLFNKKQFRVWMSRTIPSDAKIIDGSNFSQDARGNWFLNIVLRVKGKEPKKILSSVGIDLGLKNFATLSTGETIEPKKFYRREEHRLSSAQRAKKKKFTKNIHKKIANKRKDFLHKLSNRLSNEHQFIVVGDVCSSSLAKTNLAKSILDAGWSTFRFMLAYKSIRNGARYMEVDEKFTTQTCSDCGSISGPKGRKGLRVREWACKHCDSIHDRDVNSAKNILRLGHQTP